MEKFKEIYDVFEDEKHGIFQIRCKTDVLTIEFTDHDKKEIFKEITKKLQHNGKSNLETLSKSLHKRYDKEKVFEVINDLKDNGLLEDTELRELFSNKLREQVNFWSHGGGEPDLPTAKETQQKIETTKLALIGSDLTLNLLESKAANSGFKHIDRLNTLSNTNGNQVDLEKFIAACDFFIVDADRWNPYLLDEANRIAVDLNKPWILIRGLNDVTATVGPLFIGKETGCYHCLMSRLKSNMEFVPYFDEYEKYLKEKRISAKTGGAPIVLYDILSSISILEAIKYITAWTVPTLFKAMIAIDIFSYEIKTHPLLKVPTCPVCAPSYDFHPAPWLEPVTLR